MPLKSKIIHNIIHHQFFFFLFWICLKYVCYAMGRFMRWAEPKVYNGRRPNKEYKDLRWMFRSLRGQTIKDLRPTCGHPIRVGLRVGGQGQRRSLSVVTHVGRPNRDMTGYVSLSMCLVNPCDWLDKLLFSWFVWTNCRHLQVNLILLAWYHPSVFFVFSLHYIIFVDRFSWIPI